jgi:hypothetical protein
MSVLTDISVSSTPKNPAMSAMIDIQRQSIVM